MFDDKCGRYEGFGIGEIMKSWARQGLSDQELLARPKGSLCPFVEPIFSWIRGCARERKCA